MISVILAGGKGIRLWPESRQQRPKQLCKFVGDRSMLDHTIDRLFSAGSKRVIIITSFELLDNVKQLVSLRADQSLIEIYSEPELRNTAPAVGLILAKCLEEEEDGVLGIFPADHHIGNVDVFRSSLEKAVHAAEKGHLVTIGIRPDRAETGYGYIEKTRWEIGEMPEVFQVNNFYEKPALEIAQSYLDSGDHLWNAGIYIGHIQTFLEEFAQHLPELHHEIQRGYSHYLNSYGHLPEVSLDYGIAEKSNRMVVVSADFNWCDLGSWNAIADLYPADEKGNVKSGSGIFAFDSQNCVIKQKEKNIVLFGVENLLVVETEDVIMIAPRDQCQNIRNLTDLLATKESSLL